eukprot:6729123-Alexandrium_andersonii.AAC.1
MVHAPAFAQWPPEPQDADWASLSLLAALQRDRGRPLVVGLSAGANESELGRMRRLGLSPGIARGAAG